MMTHVGPFAEVGGAHFLGAVVIESVFDLPESVHAPFSLSITFYRRALHGEVGKNVQHLSLRQMLVVIHEIISLLLPCPCVHTCVLAGAGWCG